MPRILILSDIHHRWRVADSIIAHEKPHDRVIFLGDYFDDFGDNVSITIETARWLKRNLNNPKFTFLFGNHDMAYAFINRRLLCTGYTLEKDMAIAHILNRDDWNKLKFFTTQDGWLFSHAGLTADHLPPTLGAKVTLKWVTNFLNREAEKCWATVDVDYADHWFYRYSPFREQGMRVPNVSGGGILWCDSREFIGIDGIKQIFGHTYQAGGLPTWQRGDTVLDIMPYTMMNLKQDEHFHYNLCLDTHLNHYAVMTDGVIEVKRFSDL